MEPDLSAVRQLVRVHRGLVSSSAPRPPRSRCSSDRRTPPALTSLPLSRSCSATSTTSATTAAIAGTAIPAWRFAPSQGRPRRSSGTASMICPTSSERCAAIPCGRIAANRMQGALVQGRRDAVFLKASARWTRDAKSASDPERNLCSNVPSLFRRLTTDQPDS
jgi:hypothetical protein